MNKAQTGKGKLTAERLRQLLHYDPSLGIFTWRAPTSNSVSVGTEAGSVCHGYCWIKVDGRMSAASHLAWFWVMDRWPKADIDHANLIRDDNRFYNLREATKSLNGASSRARGRSGFKGVYRACRGGWQAKITVGGKRVFLGTFSRPEHAAYIYHANALWRFGEFARVNSGYRKLIEPDVYGDADR
jgi:hypothetical protein